MQHFSEVAKWGRKKLSIIKVLEPLFRGWVTSSEERHLPSLCGLSESDHSVKLHTVTSEVSGTCQV